MQLAKIKGVCSRFSNALSKFLGVDVLIVDKNLKTMGVTVSYFEQLYVIRRSSIIGQCIASKKPLAIEDRRKRCSSRDCPEYEICEMQGVICTPILYQDEVIGAIALIVPRRRVDLISKNLDNSIEVLQNMGAFLVSQLEKCDKRIELDTVQQEYEALADCVDECIAVADNNGIIEYANQRFFETFCRGHESIGHSLYEFVPRKFFADSMGTENEIEDRPFFVESGDAPLCGLVSSCTISDKNMPKKKILVFRSSNVLTTEGPEKPQTEETSAYTWKQCQWCFSEDVVLQAKNFCNSAQPVLIEGGFGSQNQYLAECIHKHSDRGGFQLLSIDCNRQDRTLEEGIFGRCGILFRGNRSTVLIQNVEMLSCRLQLKLANFLQTGMLIWEDRAMGRVDVRVICLVSRDAGKLLIPQLRACFDNHVLEIPPINTNEEHLRHLIQDELRYYKKLYHKSSVKLMDSGLNCLCAYDWPGDFAELSQVMDRLVYYADGAITAANLNSVLHFALVKNQTLDKIEQDQIEELLKRNYSKKEVAELLGISRATLYRKIKQYQLT